MKMRERMSNKHFHVERTAEHDRSNEPEEKSTKKMKKKNRREKRLVVVSNNFYNMKNISRILEESECLQRIIVEAKKKKLMVNMRI